MLAQTYLDSIKKEFTNTKKLADKAMVQISDEDFFFEPNEQSNSIATIIKHMHGNMISRWTEFRTTDGEKPTRNRDTEFESIFYTDKDDILEKWETGWKCFNDALYSVKTEDLENIILIRGEEYSILGALERQVAHYAYHVGQIVYLARFLAKKNWVSLSIPKGKSEEFNKEFLEKQKK
ncbi:DUF1572 domain-containing protein [soil metagenome]